MKHLLSIVCFSIDILHKEGVPYETKQKFKKFALHKKVKGATNKQPLFGFHLILELKLENFMKTFKENCFSWKRLHNLNFASPCNAQLV